MTEKLQEHFRMTKEFPILLRWRIVIIIIMLRQSEQWLNEIAETLSLLRKVSQVAKIFRLYENTSYEQVLPWNKSMKQKISGISREKSSSEMRLLFQKVNITWMWISLHVSCRLRIIFDFYNFFFFFFLMFYCTEIQCITSTFTSIVNVD